MFETQPPKRLGADFTTGVFARIGVDRYTVGSSALGAVYLAWTARGVSALRLASSPDAEAAFTGWYRERIGRRVVRALETDAIAGLALAKLHDASADEVPLDLEAATPLERAVLANVAQIRSGYARPQELVAADVGPACDAQTVARVLTHNALPLLIPCHRVVVSDDRCCSSAYVFGSRAQAELLAAEGLDSAAVDRVIADGFRYIENDGWFCLPTCGDIASRMGEAGFAGLHSLAQAQARGLRACESCRPIAA